VTFLWAFNMILVMVDLFLYFLYIGDNKKQMAAKSENK
jgi:hypothetical protein